MDKILLIDKPPGWTSFDVVAKIRSEARKKPGAGSEKRLRVGHAGTLDPFATGLLLVLVGAATKKQDRFVKLDKEYEATMRLGCTSTTGDPEGVVKKRQKKYRVPSEASIRDVLGGFIGDIEQVPPAFSAIRVDGKRSYELARAGRPVRLKPRPVTIRSLEILCYDWPTLKIKVVCSSGTYVRTLGEDIGEVLKTGAYLTELRRTKIGEHNVRDALSIFKVDTIDLT